MVHTHQTAPPQFVEAQKLRDLAAWYRQFAERAGNPAIWEARLRTAEDLEKKAASLAERRGAPKRRVRQDEIASACYRRGRRLIPVAGIVTETEFE